VVAEEFGDGVNIDTTHDKIAGEGGAEHFDVGVI
jgi:hypothetical protein